jgi:hypothetical protein
LRGGSFAASFGREPYDAAAAAWRAANLHISAANSRGPAPAGKAWMNLLHHEPKVTLCGVIPGNVIAWHAGSVHGRFGVGRRGGS